MLTPGAMNLPRIDSVFPENRRRPIVVFWIGYWAWFFALLPWMLLRQLGISLHQALATLATWNRTVELGDLQIVFMNSLPAFALTTIFGERFNAILYRDVLIDPGPLFGRGRLQTLLPALAGKVSAVVATHAHEEHVGNAAFAGATLGVPVYGSEVTLDGLRNPEELTLPRRAFIGQPEPSGAADVRPIPDVLRTGAVTFEVIRSPGHCDGHVSLFARESGVLFAGDSFLHAVFTAPNRDVSGAEWIDTLRGYCRLDVRTMVGTHGYVSTVDEGLPARGFVVRREDPRRLIREKLEFMEWARDVVAEGERRELPYPVIEACLFPWQRFWSWQNWFADESGR
ncbi:MAG: MBL fold metallo-hydrolase, partial [Candidatus Binatia bacterium]